MAMVVYNNMGAVKTLNTLNTNSNQLAKDLKKVSTGMRINSASDGTSEYAFSMRLRSLEGALGQDIENVEKGDNLVAIAEGGIQEIINIMRGMKEMALNSANDTNTDMDRETMQKEFAKKMETIVDIAAETNYNGRILLNGDYSRPVSVTMQKTNANVIGLANNITGYYGASSTASGGRSGGGVPVQKTITGTGSWSLSQSGSAPATGYSWTSSGVGQSVGSTMQFDQISAKLDFTGASVNGSLPNALDGEGFAVLCGGCGQYINFIFDASTTSSSYNPTPSSSNPQAREYRIGVANVATLADLPEAVFQGVKSVGPMPAPWGYMPYVNDPNYPTNVLVDDGHQLRIAEDPANLGTYIILKNNDGTSLQFYDKGAVSDPVDVVPYKPSLIIHTGPKQNQYVSVYINSMHPIAMGLNEARVTPRGKAVQAISIVDGAIEYALNEQTYMGSYRQRLLEAKENLVTALENTTATKSTVQDADMAREMQNYTKSNVLSQTAQSMLSQANQNASSVLDILQ